MSWYVARSSNLNNYYPGTIGLNYSFTNNPANKQTSELKKKDKPKVKKQCKTNDTISPRPPTKTRKNTTPSESSQTKPNNSTTPPKGKKKKKGKKVTVKNFI